MSLTKILGDEPITPPNLLPLVENSGRQPIHAWICDVYLRTTG